MISIGIGINKSKKTILGGGSPVLPTVELEGLIEQTASFLSSGLVLPLEGRVLQFDGIEGDLDVQPAPIPAGPPAQIIASETQVSDDPIVFTIDPAAELFRDTFVLIIASQSFYGSKMLPDSPGNAWDILLDSSSGGFGDGSRIQVKGKPYTPGMTEISLSEIFDGGEGFKPVISATLLTIRNLGYPNEPNKFQAVTASSSSASELQTAQVVDIPENAFVIHAAFAKDNAPMDFTIDALDSFVDLTPVPGTTGAVFNLQYGTLTAGGESSDPASIFYTGGSESRMVGGSVFIRTIET